MADIDLTTPLAQDALNQWEQHQAAEQAEEQDAHAAQIDAARAHLSVVLGDDTAPRDVSTLTVADSIFGDNRSQVVFTDGGLALSVQDTGDGWRVFLVTGDGAGWVSRGEVISLWSLGKLLGGLPVQPADPAPTYPLWVQPTGAHDAYPLTTAGGDPVRVLYDGKVWENIEPNNVWIPGQYGWKEVTV